MTPSTHLSMSATDQLVAIEAIKKVKYKYAYSADHHLWDDFVSVFAPDAVFDEGDLVEARQPFTNDPVSETIASYLADFGSGVAWPIVGRDAIYVQHIGVPADHSMVHHLSNAVVELTSETTATALFRFESHHWFAAGQPVQYMHNFGSYHETYVRLEDGHWYIQTLKLERRRVECR